MLALNLFFTVFMLKQSIDYVRAMMMRGKIIASFPTLTPLVKDTAVVAFKRMKESEKGWVSESTDTGYVSSLF